MESLLIILVILLIIAIALGSSLESVGPRQELAAELSLTLSPEGDAALESDLSHFSLMRRGRNRKLNNLVGGGLRGIDLVLFDYRYTDGHRRNTRTHRLSVAVLSSPLLELPAFTLEPGGGFLVSIAKLFGYQDIDFTENPTFNKNFTLRGPDEQAIRLAFSEPVVQHFERYLEQRHPSIEVLGQGSRLIVATYRQQPEHLRNFLEHAFGIYGILKPEGPGDEDPVLTHSADQG